MGPKLKQSFSLNLFKKFHRHAKHEHVVATVIDEYEAANDKELSLRIGAEVVVIEVYPSPAGPPWCLVRTVPVASDSEPKEGVIPSVILDSFPKAYGANSHAHKVPAHNDKVHSLISPSHHRPSSEDLASLDLPDEEFRPRSHSSSTLSRISKSSTGPTHPSKTLRRFFSIKAAPKKKTHKAADPHGHRESILDLINSAIGSKEPDDPLIQESSLPPSPLQLHNLSTDSSSVFMDQKTDTRTSSLQTSNGSGSFQRADETGADNYPVRQPSSSPDHSADSQLSTQMEENYIGDTDNNNLLNGGMDDSQTEVKPEMSDADSQEIAKQKRSYVLMELLETEKDYVENLSKIVNGYMETLKTMELPEDLIGKDKIVFGNIHQIYDFHRETFLPEIEKLVADAQGLGLLFKRYEKRLSMYVKYCENKPKSEFIVAEYLDTIFNEIKAQLNHRLQLTDLLIKPVQRIMKYQLLLKDVLKYTKRSGESCDSLEDAIRVMHCVPKEANDMMNVGRLQGFDGKLTAHGKLLLQDTLPIAELNPNKADLKFKERRIFVFEQIIILSEVIESKNALVPPHYIFKHAIKVNKMSLENDVAGNPFLFKLMDKTPGHCLTIIIQTTNGKHKEQWTSLIRNMLDMQGDILMALQNPTAYVKSGLSYDTIDSHSRTADDTTNNSTDQNSRPVHRKSSLFSNFKKGKPKTVSSNDSKSSVSIR